MHLFSETLLDKTTKTFHAIAHISYLPTMSSGLIKNSSLSAARLRHVKGIILTYLDLSTGLMFRTTTLSESLFPW